MKRKFNIIMEPFVFLLFNTMILSLMSEVLETKYLITLCTVFAIIYVQNFSSIKKIIHEFWEIVLSISFGYLMITHLPGLLENVLPSIELDHIWVMNISVGLSLAVTILMTFKYEKKFILGPKDKTIFGLINMSGIFMGMIALVLGKSFVLNVLSISCMIGYSVCYIGNVSKNKKRG